MKAISTVLFSTAMILMCACQSTQPNLSQDKLTADTMQPSSLEAQELSAHEPEEDKEPTGLEQLDAIWDSLDRSPIPQLNYSWSDWHFDEDVMPDNLPPQVFYQDDPIPYQLSMQIRTTIFYHRTDFYPPEYDYAELVQKGYSLPDQLLQAAIFHSDPLDMGRYESSPQYGYDVPYYADYPNHIVSATVRFMARNGYYLSNIYSGKDVREKAHQLFGKNIEIFDHSIDPYLYFSEADIYCQQGDFGGPVWPYPQIIRYEKLDNGYSCDAVISNAVYPDELPWVFDENIHQLPLTKENFESATAHLKLWRYTFTWEGDNLILSKLETLRDGKERH